MSNGILYYIVCYILFVIIFSFLKRFTMVSGNKMDFSFGQVYG